MKVTHGCVGLAIALGGLVTSAEEMPRVASYALDVTYDNSEATLEAEAGIRFAEGAAKPPVLEFYLHGELWVDEVTFDGEPVTVGQDLVIFSSDYSMVARRIRIDMSGRDLPNQVSIRYGGHLNPSVVRAPSNYMRVDREGVFLRSFPYSVWFPVFLDAKEDTYPVDAELTIRTPPGFVAVATGERLSDLEEDGMRIARWRTVHDDLFNLQMTVRPFAVRNEGGIHLYFLQDPESRATASKIQSYSAELVSYYRTNYADRHSGGQLHVVEMPRFGDISSGNMVGISEKVWRDFDPSSYSGRTLAHELVHPYVQIPVPSDSDVYALVIEGFPSYFHLPAMAEILGDEFYDRWIQATEDRYLEQRRTGLDRRGRPLPPEKPLLELTADDIGTYKDRFVLSDRAPLFCNWLRTRMGDERFGLFTRKLFALQTLDEDMLVATIESFLPGSGDDISLWLGTTEFPDRFRIDRGSGD